jgi:pimeloyl-ACP methyl ester carboxylesterase
VAQIGNAFAPTLGADKRGQRYLVPLAFAQQLEQYLRYKELVVIKGAGHVPMWDRPQEFNRAMMKFLLADEGRKTNDE